ncbi:hypothetical protein MJH12_13720 [bacterium]|nr:hypothetical protein [bacterium]
MKSWTIFLFFTLFTYIQTKTSQDLLNYAIQIESALYSNPKLGLLKPDIVNLKLDQKLTKHILSKSPDMKNWTENYIVMLIVPKFFKFPKFDYSTYDDSKIMNSLKSLDDTKFLNASLGTKTVMMSTLNIMINNLNKIINPSTVKPIKKIRSIKKKLLHKEASIIDFTFVKYEIASISKVKDSPQTLSGTIHYNIKNDSLNLVEKINYNIKFSNPKGEVIYDVPSIYTSTIMPGKTVKHNEPIMFFTNSKSPMHAVIELFRSSKIRIDISVIKTSLKSK